jgi:NAD(P)-dependent dehydrogenase (short-subunit alcohol dehydrogenase family)
MLLKGRNAVVYGAGGALGGAVSRAFAREGAAVFLTGRRLAPLDEVATKILVAGGTAEAAVVDANAEQAVEEHAQTVVDRAGSLDISSLSCLSSSHRAVESSAFWPGIPARGRGR